MRTNRLYPLYLLGLLVCLVSVGCRRGDTPSASSVVPIPEYRQSLSELDRWIDATFLPYGIEVSYRWDKNAIAHGSYAYPPSLSSIRPVLEAVKALWLDLYTHKDANDRPFLLGRAPVRIYLLGGKGLDAQGLELIAAPKSSAVEMYLYDVNAFDPKSDDAVYALVHSLQHQFARRLMELYPYDRDAFRSLSDYSDASHAVALEGQRKARTAMERLGVSSYANGDGFLTIHGMLSSEADFADIIAANLCNHPAAIRDAATRAGVPRLSDPDPEVNKIFIERAKRAEASIRAKQAMVETYYHKTVGLRLSQMQLRSIELINQYKQQHHAQP